MIEEYYWLKYIMQPSNFKLKTRETRHSSYEGRTLPVNYPNYQVPSTIDRPPMHQFTNRPTTHYQ